MALHGPTFFKRLSSAIVFSALVMTGLLWHSLAFFALLVVIQILCLRDYFRLSGFILLDKQLGFSHKLWVQVLSLLPLATAAFPLFGIEKKMLWSCLAAILPILLLLLYLAKNGTLVKMISGVSGVIYIVLPLVFFVELKN